MAKQPNGKFGLEPLRAYSNAHSCWTGLRTSRKIAPMKRPYGMLLILSGLLFGQFAQAEHTVALRGIVHVTGQDLALVQIDKESWVVSKGERFEVGSHPSVPGELLELDLTNEIVITRVDGRDHTNSLPSPGRPPTSRSWIHLQDADFRAAMGLYALAAGRTILLHPLVATTPFSCTASWAEEAPATNEITACFVAALNQRATASLEDGNCFLQIVPATMTQSASLGSKNLPESRKEVIAAGLIDFEGVEMDQVIDIYGKLIGRQRKDPKAHFEGGARMYLQTVCPLSKPQVIYALETLFRWNRGKITLYEDNTFSVTPLSESER